ncbi:hypothetical protein AM377_15055 [Serratia marcescens]|nr:hypothetical protein AM377_15055 [Serratia marcescens]
MLNRQQNPAELIIGLLNRSWPLKGVLENKVGAVSYTDSEKEMAMLMTKSLLLVTNTAKAALKSLRKYPKQ